MDRQTESAELAAKHALCAQSLGYRWEYRKHSIWGTQSVFYYSVDKGEFIPYSPSHDNMQAFELLIWIQPNVRFLENGSAVVGENTQYVGEGKTLHEALVDHVSKLQAGGSAEG